MLLNDVFDQFCFTWVHSESRQVVGHRETHKEGDKLPLISRARERLFTIHSARSECHFESSSTSFATFRHFGIQRLWWRQWWWRRDSNNEWKIVWKLSCSILHSWISATMIRIRYLKWSIFFSFLYPSTSRGSGVCVPSSTYLFWFLWIFIAWLRLQIDTRYGGATVRVCMRNSKLKFKSTAK